IILKVELTMSNLNKLTMKELSKIAKDEYKLPLSVTIDGKRKRFNKPELIEMIEIAIIKKDPVIKSNPELLEFNCVNVESVQNETAPLEEMVKRSKDHLKFGEYETVLNYVKDLKTLIKESNNSLQIN